MGKTHATSGAAVWLGGTELAHLVGYGPTTLQVLAGTALCSVGALVPDVDHPDSTVAHSAGFVTEKTAEGVAAVSAWVYRCTRTDRDRPGSTGHRTLTHTLVFAALFAAAVTALADLGTRWASLVILHVACSFASSTLLPRRMHWVRVRLPGNRRRTRFPLAAMLAGGVAYPTWYYGAAGWWIGAALGIGCIIHCLGDSLTLWGTPLFWPVKVAGQRWHPVRPPAGGRMRTGGAAARPPALAERAADPVRWDRRVRRWNARRAEATWVEDHGEQVVFWASSVAAVVAGGVLVLPGLLGVFLS